MIDKSKTYRTRDGREVRIYATDGISGWPVHGAVKTEAGWRPLCWLEDGESSRVGLKSESDLIEVRPRIKREVWVNVYPDGHFNTTCACVGYGAKRDADHAAVKRDRIACVRLTIDCEEGEGL